MSEVSELNWLLVDMNAFFTSVEQQMNPKLRGKPVAVIPMMAETTSCIAASYEAKAFGVKTGTMVRDAKKMCPGIVFISGRHEHYIEYHQKIIAAIERCHPVTSVLSVDEMGLRLGGRDRKLENAMKLAHEVKQSILQVGEVLTSSVGLAPNRFLAKLASDMQKPNGLISILPSEIPHKFIHLKPRDLCGIGHNMEARLHQYGIVTMRDLWALSVEEMTRVWGGIGGERFYRWLRGEDFLIESESGKSIGHSNVLSPEYRNEQGSQAVLQRLLYKAGVRLRRADMLARRMAVKIRFLDQTKWGMEVKMSECQDDLTLREVLRMILAKKPKKNPLKVSIVLFDFIHQSERTISMFDDPKRTNLTKALDNLNTRYGKHTVYFGGFSQALEAAPTRIAFTSIPDPEI